MEEMTNMNQTNLENNESEVLEEVFTSFECFLDFFVKELF